MTYVIVVQKCHVEFQTSFIQYLNKSRQDWRLKYTTALQHKLESIQTNSSLTIYLCLILTKWMDTGTIVVTYYPKWFHRVIYSKYAID